MDINIKAVFDRIASDVKVDEKLVDRLSRYETEFTHRNKDHIEFFSGNLLGVEKVRFLPADYARFFDEVVQTDDTELQRALHALPSINSDWIVSSDVFNITSMWLIHVIYAIGKAKHIPEATRKRGMMSAALIFNYKVLTSKLAHDFKFPADRETAIAVYAALNKKYSLKKHGSWSALLYARAEDMLSENGIHWNTIANFDKDKGILYMITDSQGRVRDIVKTLWDVLNAIRASDAKIVSTSSFVTIDGEAELGDLNRKLVAYKAYVHSVAGNRNSFIKNELIDVVIGFMRTMNSDHFKLTLQSIADGFARTNNAQYEKLIDETMIHAFDYLSRERKKRNRGFDLGQICVKLRGQYMAARTTDPTMLDLRNLADELVAIPLRGKSAAAQAAVRTGILLYIVLRALTRNFYG
jgi:hypothetical protein